jgi:hypothetical protein
LARFGRGGHLANLQAAIAGAEKELKAVDLATSPGEQAQIAADHYISRQTAQYHMEALRETALMMNMQQKEFKRVWDGKESALRDQFALAGALALLDKAADSGYDLADAKRAYALADAMLQARGGEK